jgi:predicted RNA-binding Zn ribbon-like protein
VGPSTVRPASLDFVVEFVNEYATRARQEAEEETASYEDVRTLPGASSVPDIALRRPTRRDLISLADRLHEVFALAGEAPALALESLNALLREAPAVPQLADGDDGVNIEWRLLGPVTPVSRLQASSAIALHHWIAEHGSLGRLGTCADFGCVDVYLDATQAETRRYCSATCANRAKVAAHRARARAAKR